MPATALVTATVENNEVRDHVVAAGAGLRVGAVGGGAPNVAGTNKVAFTNNNLVNNTFGIVIEAAFPVAGSSLRGDIEVTTSGNTISQSCQSDLFVAFSRRNTGLGIQSGPYLRSHVHARARS